MNPPSFRLRRSALLFPLLLLWFFRGSTKAPERLATEVGFGVVKNRTFFIEALMDEFTASPKSACGARRDC